MVIDIERRLELATVELLEDYECLRDIVDNIRVRYDSSQRVDYPCAVIEARGGSEMGQHTGWYLLALQLSGLSYRNDDPARVTVKQIAGALRGWAQQTDLADQLNSTTSASTEATALDAREAWIDGSAFDAGDDKINEMVVSLAVLRRLCFISTAMKL